jgi:hypothetical protein
MSDHILTNETLPVNEDDAFDNISLDQVDPVFQFTVVPNALVRDKTISPNCRWLIIYLLSNKPGWTIKSRQLWEHTKGFIGRDGIRKVLNEAINSGYIRRDVVLKTTPKGKLRGYSYVVASTPKFKKVLREPENQGPDDQEPENQGTKELLSQEILSLSTKSSLKVPAEPIAAKAAEMDSVPPPKPKREKPEFAPKVRELGTQMINSMTQIKADYIPPKNLTPFLHEVDFMLRLDKRDPQKAIDIFNWTLGDSFWADKMFRPNPAKYLREKFDQFEMKMKAKPSEPKRERKFAPCSNDDKAYEMMKEMSARAI